MLVADEHSFTRPTHSMLIVMFFKSLQTREYWGILFWLVFFCAEGIIRQWIETDCLWLFSVEGLGNNGSVVSIEYWLVQLGNLEVSFESTPCVMQSGLQADFELKPGIRSNWGGSDIRLRALHSSHRNGRHDDIRLAKSVSAHADYFFYVWAR